MNFTTEHELPVHVKLDSPSRFEEFLKKRYEELGPRKERLTNDKITQLTAIKNQGTVADFFNGSRATKRNNAIIILRRLFKHLEIHEDEWESLMREWLIPAPPRQTTSIASKIPLPSTAKAEIGIFRETSKTNRPSPLDAQDLPGLYAAKVEWIRRHPSRTNEIHAYDPFTEFSQWLERWNYDVSGDINEQIFVFRRLSKNRQQRSRIIEFLYGCLRLAKSNNRNLGVFSIWYLVEQNVCFLQEPFSDVSQEHGERDAVRSVQLDDSYKSSLKLDGVASGVSLFQCLFEELKPHVESNELHYVCVEVTAELTVDGDEGGAGRVAFYRNVDERLNHTLAKDDVFANVSGYVITGYDYESPCLKRNNENKTYSIQALKHILICYPLTQEMISEFSSGTISLQTLRNLIECLLWGYWGYMPNGQRKEVLREWVQAHLNTLTTAHNENDRFECMVLRLSTKGN